LLSVTHTPVGAAFLLFRKTVHAYVGINLTGTYIGESFIDDQTANQFTDANNNAIPRNARVFRVAPEFYLDGQVRLKVAKRFEFFVGADNILDNKPPYTADVAAAAGQDTDTGTYDPLGRRYYVGARVKF